jgi:hypothetical protein
MYLLFRSLSTCPSKSGGDEKAKTPVPETIEKAAASVPEIDQESDVPVSISVAEYVSTEVIFSAWLTACVVAEEFVEIVGASLTLVTVIAIDWFAKFPAASVALTEIS